MIKFLKKSLSVLLAAAATLTFIGCSGGGDNGYNDGQRFYGAAVYEFSTAEISKYYDDAVFFQDGFQSGEHYTVFADNEEDYARLLLEGRGCIYNIDFEHNAVFAVRINFNHINRYKTLLTGFKTEEGAVTLTFNEAYDSLVSHALDPHFLTVVVPRSLYGEFNDIKVEITTTYHQPKTIVQ